VANRAPTALASLCEQAPTRDRPPDDSRGARPTSAWKCRSPAASGEIDSLAGEGLGQLSEISTLLLIAAVGAMAAALISSVCSDAPRSQVCACLA